MIVESKSRKFDYAIECGYYDSGVWLVNMGKWRKM